MNRFVSSLLVVLALILSAFAAEKQVGSVPGVKPLADPPGLHNLFALGTNMYSGSAPDGDAGFAALANLGVKTIITVDGTKPDVERAHRFGMRYIHLPHGYDGIATNIQWRLIRAAETQPGPIYVHCHHGKHRGPTAAAVICLAEQGWTPEQAADWLEAAGTATNYSGLFKTVRDFHPPNEAQLEALPTNFPETTQVSGLVDAMVEIDGRWDNLKAARAAGYRSPSDHPDLDPPSEAVILWEHFREARRMPEAARHGGDFIERLREAEFQAKELERKLRSFAQNPAPKSRAGLDESFEALGKSCAACHREYRDPAGIQSHIP